MDQLTIKGRNLGIHPHTEMGPSSSVAPTILPPTRTISITDNEKRVITIPLPPPVTEDAIGEYTDYLSSLAVFSIPSTFSPADIPIFREKYQIPAGVRIRAPDVMERACYYKPGEVCFYEAAFEHGLRFPMDDHLRELLIALDLAPVQVPPNMWSCLIGSILIFRAISAGSHEISPDEFLALFQIKDGGGKNKGILSCSSRLGAAKIIRDFPSSIPNWKKRFFFISGAGWEYDPRAPSVVDLKTWFTSPNSIQRKTATVPREWIKDAERFSVKNYAALTTPEMLWRYGLGPRPTNMDPAIKSVEELELNKPFVVLLENVPLTFTAKSSQSGSVVPATTQEFEGAEEEEEVDGLQKRKSKQPAGGVSHGVPLSIPPLCRLPAGVPLIINPNLVNKRKRSLQRGFQLKKMKASEGSPSSEQGLGHSGTPGTFVELMTSSLAVPPSLDSSMVRFERIEELENEVPPSFLLRGDSPTRSRYRQVISDDDKMQEIHPSVAQQRTNFEGPSSSATPNGDGDDSEFFIPGVTLPPLGKDILQSARAAGVNQLEIDN